MGKRMMTGLIALAFVCSSLLLVTSCAKKQVKVSEGLQPSAKEMKAKGPVIKKAQMPEATKEAELKAARAREAARQAKLRELEKAQKLADEIRAFESDNIYFAFDKSDLMHPARAVLKDKAEWLHSNPGYSVLVEGHCDERGTNEYNLALGERRAHAAKKFLVALGISADRIKTISYGEERPADPRHNVEAWAKNRRDEFKLIKKR